MVLFFLVLALVFGGTARDAAAATIYVTYLDPRPISAGPGCSLPEAIYSSILHDSFDGGAHGIAIDATDPDHFIITGCAAGTGNDTIVLPTKGVLSFDQFLDGDAHNPYGPTATPIIFSTITIEGHGATLQWVGSGPARLFAVGPGSIAAPNGTASGTGNLTLRDVYVQDFHVAGGSGGPGGGGGMGAGGAIFVQSGGLTIENSTFRGNAAVGGNGTRVTNFSTTGGGGGVAGSGGVLVGGGGGARGDGGSGTAGMCSGTGGGNGTGGGGGGGIVFAGGDSATCNNGDGIGGASGLYCGGNGGDFDNDGHPGQCPGGGGGGSGNRAHVFFCGPDGGIGSYGGGGGGGACNAGNGGFGGGGGAGNNNGGNGGFGGGGGGGGMTGGGAVAGSGGAFGGDGGNGSHVSDSFGGGGAGLGGAIFNDAGSVTIRNSTFTENSAVPGSSGQSCCPPAAKAVGGAIFSFAGSLTVVDSTISANTAMNGELGNVNGAIAVFGDDDSNPASFTLNNSIIAHNGASECLVWGMSGNTSTGTHNVITDDSLPVAFNKAAKERPIFACPGPAHGIDPQLGPLQANGGYTPTMAIPFGSVAMSAADSTTSLATDQRGAARPQGGGWDIGAFEVCRIRFGGLVMPFPCGETTNPGFEGTAPLTMAASLPAAGSVSPLPGSHDEPANTVIVLTATPSPGYIFVGWSGNVTDPTSPTTTVIMDQAHSVMAIFALEETGFVPPDKATAACEDGVTAALTKLSTALVGCHVSAGDAAASGKPFDEEACEQKARAGYDLASAKLKSCPACLDFAARAALAEQVTTTLEERDGEIHCAGTVALGSDDGGFVPPDKPSRKCEDATAKSFATLFTCVERCHAKTADRALKGKPFAEEACEETDVKSSCRAKYDTTVVRRLKKPLACPACLGVVQQAMLGDEAERDVDSLRGSIYCAGTETLTND